MRTLQDVNVKFYQVPNTNDGKVRNDKMRRSDSIAGRRADKISSGLRNPFFIFDGKKDDAT